MKLSVFGRGALIVLLLSATGVAGAADKPNILWLVQEDASPWMGCYGHKANANATPNIDKLASDGVLFTRAFTPTPVCSTCPVAADCPRREVGRSR